MPPVQVVSVSCRLAALLALAFAALLPLQAQQAQPARQAQQAPHLLQQVDPFIGVDGHGAVFPGAVVPFGMVSLSPDMVAPQETSGYRSGQPVIGFSHNHSSGTGGTARYGNLLVAPQSGPLLLQQLSKGAAIRDEQAAPGYYAATLAAAGIRAELTTSARSGVHRYTFPEAGTARVLLDVAASRNTNKADKPPSSVCTASDARMVGDRRFEGQASFEGGWGGNNPHTVYFVAEFDRPFARAGGWQDGAAVDAVDVSAATDAAAVNVSGKQAGLYAEFNLRAGESVGLKLGMSYLSLDNARKNLAQTQSQSFEQVRAAAQALWADYLGRIQVEGGSETDRKIFYSALYRTVLMPADVTGDVPGFDPHTPQFWNFYCFWDTYHTVNPLYTLIVPQRQSQIIQAALAIHDKHGWLPDAWIANDYGGIQGGTHADTLIADAFVKGLTGFDRQKAYAAIRKNGSQPGPALAPGPASWGNIKMGRFADYFSQGYLPIDNPLGGNLNSSATSRTLEYSVNDFSIATVARLLGKTQDAERFSKQALNGWALWHPDFKHFWAKDRAGRWVDGFKPTLYTHSYQGAFYESTPWHYAFAMRHDMQGLINRHGGNAGFINFIDQYFDGGFHGQDNQPTLLTPWLHTYAGRPDKNVDRVRDAMAKNYRAARAGLPGNDDAGTMSAWYVFAAMGFYPNTGQDVYLLASPIFSKVSLQLGESGKQFVITAVGLSVANRYVQSATLQGEPWDQGWFRHGDIAGGAELVLTMGPKPSAWGMNKPPPSLSAAP